MSDTFTANPVDPPLAADERTMLVAFLDFLREEIVRKVQGLSEEQARWTPAATANSPIGIVNHLVYVEHWWFHEVFTGAEPDIPPPGDPNDPDADFHPPSGQSLAETVERYRAECARATRIVTEAGSLDDAATRDRYGKVTLRWVLAHMIEETGRHAGHLDITRELIDGSVGD